VSTSPEAPRAVLHVCDKFGVSGSSIHGVSRLFAWWFPRYDPARYRPFLAGLKNKDAATAALARAGVDAAMFGRSAFDPRVILDIRREARLRNARVLHVHGYSSANFGRIAARSLGIPLVLHEHFADPAMPAYQRLPDFALRSLTSRGIAVSRSTADFMIRERYVPRDRVEVVFNGAPLDEFAPAPAAEGARVRKELGIAPDALVITTIGRLNAQKGHEVLLAAAAIARRAVPNAVFLIAGDGDREPALRTQANELGIASSVVFAGHRTDIPAVLAATDALCISSHYEGTPLVLFEAMAAGKAVVSTAVDGCREVLTDGETGLLTPPGDSGALGDALARVLGDAALRARLGNAARVLSARYDIRACVRRMQEIYDSALA
jgi:glycosyltransferase involved in cell wall biosynthesis